MSLSILCAGCSKGEREEAEGVVKGILGRRPAAEPWVVSLVKVQDDWCITMEGPGLKRASVRTGHARLREALLEAVEPGATAQAKTTPAGAVKDGHVCEKCGQSYAVVYEAAPDESQELASVACPYCWGRNQVLLGESAAYTQSFRAEKIDQR